jgi:hypothetical protein
MRRGRLIALLTGVALVASCAAPAKAEAHIAKPHVHIDLAFGNCPGFEDDPSVLGCYFEQPNGHYNIFWADHDPLTLSHEIGHVFDATVMQDSQRAAFEHIFGLDGYGWWDVFNQGGASPGEWFAEGYGRCDRHTPIGPTSGYVYDPTRAQHRAVCRLIWNADRDRLH